MMMIVLHHCHEGSLLIGVRNTAIDMIKMIFCKDEGLEKKCQSEKLIDSLVFLR